MCEKKMDFEAKTEAFHSIKRIDEILGSGIFDPKNSQHPLRESAFIEMIICLRDLMEKVETYTERISFKDDLNLNDKTVDVTDSIRHVRDAICHLDSHKRHIDENKNRVAFCFISGKGCLMKINDVEIGSDYEDDICFFYGNHKLYFKRHIIRAFNEAKEKLHVVFE